MIIFGSKDNIVQICISGFAFFLMLPIANCCIDYLVRVNIRKELQGRAWGLIGFLSQIGYVIAYGTSGLFADSLSKRMSVSIGRGSGCIVMMFGMLLSVLAIITFFLRSIRKLEGEKP